MTASPLARLSYRVSQRARFAWYLGHYIAARRRENGARDAAPTRQPLPDRPKLRHAIEALFEQDWRNIDQGLYAMPHDLMPNPARLARGSARFLKDASAVAARREERRVRDLQASEGNYPSYFLQNFHFQSGGYLTQESAEIYDFQVETLFNGAADAMRRQALVPLREALVGHDQRDMRLLDIGCGTGRFLTFVLDNYPKLRVSALDLSPAYLEEARRVLAPWRDTEFLRANAETIPLADASQDIVTIVYLFHELPPTVRRAVAREVARVLKPGGILIFVDSLQFGDVPDFDGLLEAFPRSFHEPYFLSYLEEDLSALWGGVGLMQHSTATAFLSKVSAFTK